MGDEGIQGFLESSRFSSLLAALFKKISNIKSYSNNPRKDKIGRKEIERGRIKRLRNVVVDNTLPVIVWKFIDFTFHDLSLENIFTFVSDSIKDRFDKTVIVG